MTQAAALGLKRKCLSCGSLFFDLRRDPIVCPKCAEVFTPPPPLPQRAGYRPRVVAPPTAMRTPEPEIVAETEEEDETEDGAPAGDTHILDPDVDEDDSDLPHPTES